MLAVRHLSCIRNDRLLFSKLSFNLEKGEILHLMGENGAGKSSLLQIIAGLLLPETGEIFWEDMPINIHDNYSCFYLAHKSGVKPDLTVRENLQLSALLMGRGGIQVDGFLPHFQLTHLVDMPANQLSAGQKQRVALTRLFLTEAKLWILDEPFTAIDQQSIECLKLLLQAHVMKGGMVMMTSHQAIDFSDVNVKQLWLSGDK